MVDIIKPLYRPIRSRTIGNKVKPSSSVETNTDNNGGSDYVVSRDRRKQNDRRKDRSKGRDIYDMRSGRGRRKDDPRPNIEIKV